MSDQDQPTDPLDTARDRLTDRVLAEAVSGERPPDQLAAILDRAAAERPSPRSTRQRTNRRAWIALLTIAASLAVAVALWPGRGPVDSELAMTDRSMTESSTQGVPFGYRSVESEPQTLSEDEALLDAIGQEPTAEKSSQLVDALVSTDGLATGPTLEPSGLTPPATPPLNRLAVKPSQLRDRSELRNSERRLGASSLLSTNPAAGTNPKPTYRISEETQRLLAQRRSVAVKGGVALSRSESTHSRFDSFHTELPAGDTPAVVRQRIKLRLREEQAARYGSNWRAVHDSGAGDQYAAIIENPFITPNGADALSTFSIDVDTASYTNVRQYLMQSRRLPPPSAVRVEELVNYFDYSYSGPAADSDDPFAASMEVQACPWAPTHQLVRIGIKGREVAVDMRPLSNLVFLVDVSGSMNQPNKLPLVIAGLTALTDRLGENDRVAIVVYAGSEGVVLPSTSGERRDEIRSALGRLQAGGSTAGGAGLKLAYEIAERNQIPGGVNRVILCTDGEFNVGLSGTEELTQLVETRARETGVFLTVLGFGRGNLNDAMLESISGRGDGHYAYLDSEREARRVLSRDLSGTLVTIAKDVKLQVEFNPTKVGSYRLIGYENRVMAARDFNDDTKDAGEIGAGHTVTALYEVVPVGAEPDSPPIDGLKYQKAEGSRQLAEQGGREPEASAPGVAPESTVASSELLTLKIRYKQPTGGASKKLEFPLEAVDLGPDRRSRLGSDDFRWAAAVAEFGLLLRNSQYAGDASFDGVLRRARGALGDDLRGDRSEFLDLARRAKELRNE